MIRMLSSLFTTLGEKRDFLTIGEDKLNVPTVSNSFSPIFFQSSRGDVSSAFTLTSTVELERENMVIERTESSLICSTGQRCTDLLEKGTVISILLLSLMWVCGILKLLSDLPSLARTRIGSSAVAPSMKTVTCHEKALSEREEFSSKLFSICFVRL